MLRPMMAVTILLVLLWTGTLLHDVAEEVYAKIVVTYFPNTHRLARPEQETLTANQEGALEHFHLAGVPSRDDYFSQQMESLPAAIPVCWSIKRVSVACRIYGRAPPTNFRLFPIRLYLANRHLLI